MLKIAVCDDNNIFLNKFNDYLIKKYGDYIEKIDLYIYAEKLLTTDNTYNIIFVDIEMPVIDGITFAKKYNKDATIIFVTSYDNLVFDAYNNTNSYGFIRKVDLEIDLENVMNKIINDNYNSRFITLQIACDHIERVMYKDILYIEKYVNSIIVHTTKGEYTERNTLSNITNQLDNDCFVRCHMGYIINVNNVININKNYVQLINNERVPISRKNVKEVRRIIAGGFVNECFV